MDTEERLEHYCTRQGPRAGLVVIARDLLTPAQRRRLKKKERSGKTHDHSRLPQVEVNGRVRRVPCRRCHPLGRQIRIGG